MGGYTRLQSETLIDVRVVGCAFVFPCNGNKGSIVIKWIWLIIQKREKKVYT